MIKDSLKWDVWFLGMARYASTASKDPSTKTGAVIVSPDRTIVSVGYNGFPRRMEDRPEWYNNREEKYSRIVHCEVNALMMAARPVAGCTLYTWPFACCDRCVVQMIQAGIDKFVFPEPTEDAKSRWGASIVKTKNYITDCGIAWTEVYLKTIEELSANN